MNKFFLPFIAQAHALFRSLQRCALAVLVCASLTQTALAQVPQPLNVRPPIGSSPFQRHNLQRLPRVSPQEARGNITQPTLLWAVPIGGVPRFWVTDITGDNGTPDGRDEIVVHFNGRVSLFRPSDGRLLWSSHPLPEPFQTLHARDIDRDNKPEIIVHNMRYANTNSRYLNILSGQSGQNLVGFNLLNYPISNTAPGHEIAAANAPIAIGDLVLGGQREVALLGANNIHPDILTIGRFTSEDPRYPYRHIEALTSTVGGLSGISGLEILPSPVPTRSDALLAYGSHPFFFRAFTLSPAYQLISGGVFSFSVAQIAWFGHLPNTPLVTHLLVEERKLNGAAGWFAYHHISQTLTQLFTFTLPNKGIIGDLQLKNLVFDLDGFAGAPIAVLEYIRSDGTPAVTLANLSPTASSRIIAQFDDHRACPGALNLDNDPAQELLLCRNTPATWGTSSDVVAYHSPYSPTSPAAVLPHRTVLTSTLIYGNPHIFLMSQNPNQPFVEVRPAQALLSVVAYNGDIPPAARWVGAGHWFDNADFGFALASPDGYVNVYDYTLNPRAIFYAGGGAATVASLIADLNDDGWNDIVARVPYGGPFAGDIVSVYDIRNASWSNPPRQVPHSPFRLANYNLALPWGLHLVPLTYTVLPTGAIAPTHFAIATIDTRYPSPTFTLAYIDPLSGTLAHFPLARLPFTETGDVQVVAYGKFTTTAVYSPAFFLQQYFANPIGHYASRHFVVEPTLSGTYQTRRVTLTNVYSPQQPFLSAVLPSPYPTRTEIVIGGFGDISETLVADGITAITRFTDPPYAAQRTIAANFTQPANPAHYDALALGGTPGYPGALKLFAVSYTPTGVIVTRAYTQPLQWAATWIAAADVQTTTSTLEVIAGGIQGQVMAWTPSMLGSAPLYTRTLGISYTVQSGECAQAQFDTPWVYSDAQLNALSPACRDFAFLYPLEDGQFIADIDGDARDDLLIPSINGMLYAIDAPTGQIKWGYPLFAPIDNVRAVRLNHRDNSPLTNTLQIIARTRDGYLYAIGQANFPAPQYAWDGSGLAPAEDIDAQSSTLCYNASWSGNVTPGDMPDGFRIALRDEFGVLVSAGYINVPYTGPSSGAYVMHSGPLCYAPGSSSAPLRFNLLPGKRYFAEIIAYQGNRASAPVRTDGVLIQERPDFSSSYKSVTPTALPSQWVDWQIVIRNDGSRSGNVSLSDPLPHNTQYVSFTTTPITGTGAYIPAERRFVYTASVPAYQSITLTLRTIISQTAGYVYNRASLRDLEDDAHYILEARTAVNAPNLALSAKYAPASVPPDQPIPYHIVIRNDGSQIAHQAWMHDPLPESLHVVPGTVTATNGHAVYHQPTHVVYWHGSVAPAQTITVSFLARTHRPHAFVHNCAFIGDNWGAPFERCRDTVVGAGAPSLHGSLKSAEKRQYAPGQAITFYLTLRNNGTRLAHLQGVDPLPDNLFAPGSLSFTCPQLNCALIGETLYFSGTLLPGERAVATLSGVIAPGALAQMRQNTAIVTETHTQQRLLLPYQFVVGNAPLIALHKQHAPPFVAEGQHSAAYIVVENDSPSPITVAITDSLPQGTQVTVTAPGASYNPSAHNILLHTTVSPTATFRLTYLVSILPSLTFTPSFTNVAVARTGNTVLTDTAVLVHVAPSDQAVVFGRSFNVLDNSSVIGAIVQMSGGTYHITRTNAQGQFLFRVPFNIVTESLQLPAHYWVQQRTTGYFVLPLNPKQIALSPGDVVEVNFENYPQMPGVNHIQGFVYHDVNADGFHQPNSEPGLGAVNVQITYTPLSNTHLLTTTNQGGFSFITPVSGSYRVAVIPPQDWRVTTDPEYVVHTAGGDTTLYFGLAQRADDTPRCRAAIGRACVFGYVYTDHDGVYNAGQDGLITPSDTPIPNHVVRAYAATTYTATSDANGYYVIEVPDNDLPITLTLESLTPAGQIAFSPNPISLYLTSTNALRYDFAFAHYTGTPPAVVNGFVFSDTGHDGIFVLGKDSPTLTPAVVRAHDRSLFTRWSYAFVITPTPVSNLLIASDNPALYTHTTPLTHVITLNSGDRRTTHFGKVLVPPPAYFGKLAPLNASTNTPVSLYLQWQEAGAHALYYRYCYSTTPSCIPHITATARTSTSLTGLLPATTYYWQVWACADQQCAAFTPADAQPLQHWEFTTAALPDSFNKLTPPNGALHQPINVTLTWQAPAGSVNHYRYCATTTMGCLPNISVGATTSTVLSALTPGATYYWQVRACADADCTVFMDADNENHWFFSTADLPPTFQVDKHMPANNSKGVGVRLLLTPTLSFTASGAITLQWTVPVSHPVSHYRVCVNLLSPCDPRHDAFVTTTLHSFAWVTYALQSQYFWNVVACADVDCTVYRYADSPHSVNNNSGYWSFHTEPARLYLPFATRLWPLHEDIFEPNDAVTTSTSLYHLITSTYPITFALPSNLSWRLNMYRNGCNTSCWDKDWFAIHAGDIADYALGGAPTQTGRYFYVLRMQLTITAPQPISTTLTQENALHVVREIPRHSTITVRGERDLIRNVFVILSSPDIVPYYDLSVTVLEAHREPILDISETPLFLYQTPPLQDDEIQIDFGFSPAPAQAR